MFFPISLSAWVLHATDTRAQRKSDPNAFPSMQLANSYEGSRTARSDPSDWTLSRRARLNAGSNSWNLASASNARYKDVVLPAKEPNGQAQTQ